jgi:uncharacterized membrane protein YkoI
MVSSRRAYIVAAVVFAATLGGAATARSAVAPPVGIARAQAAALARAPGGLVNTTLALDRGRLAYGVEIETAPGTVTSVEVDAGTGQVLRITGRRERGPFPREMEAP